MKRLAFRFLYLMAVMPAALSAEKLPIRAYTTAEGLPHNTVMRIVRDSHGFLWFCTLGGLARFDGYTFKIYGVDEGLRGSVTDLLETRAGEYWVATLRGLYEWWSLSSHARRQPLDRAPSPKFLVHSESFFVDKSFRARNFRE